MEGTKRYSVTLESSTGATQVVHAEGIDAGMAAQAAMRANAGWTAKHDLTVELAEDQAVVAQDEAGGSGQVNHEAPPAVEPAAVTGEGEVAGDTVPV